MENWLTVSAPVLIKTALSIIAIFTAIIVITRISGLRTFAKMSSFDFASTIAIGSVLASAGMEGASRSIVNEVVEVKTSGFLFVNKYKVIVSAQIIEFTN